MAQQKKPSDVAGYNNKCINFVQCPLCYGCRNFRNDDPACGTCLKNKKRDICNTNTHRSELIAKMVLRPKIKVDNISFKNKED